MEKPTQSTRKRFLQKAFLSCFGLVAVTGSSSASNRKESGNDLLKRASGAQRIRAAAGTVARGTFR